MAGHAQASLEKSARALGSARSPADLVDAFVLGAGSLGAGGVSLGLTRPECIATLTRGFDAERAAAYAEIPQTANLPGPGVLRTGKPAYFRNLDAAVGQYPGAAALLRGSPFEGAACLPMLGPAGPLGYLALHWDSPREFTDAEKAALGLLAATSAGALLRLAGEPIVLAEPTHDPGAGAPGPEVLTPRELEILELIAAGLTNREICERLYLSINSVKTYIRSGYRKIGVASRSRAVLWGVSHGLAGPGRRGRHT